MENQNSTQKEKKKFFASGSKKKKVIIAVIAVLLVSGFIGRGVVAHTAWIARGHPLMRTGNVTLAAKNFESMGIVFAEATGTRRSGYQATCDALMKEAAGKGADAIINVTVTPTGGWFNRTWSGSATAIKYLETIPSEITTMPVLGTLNGGFGRGF